MLSFFLCFSFPTFIFFHQRVYVLPGVCLSVCLFVSLYIVTADRIFVENFTKDVSVDKEEKN